MQYPDQLLHVTRRHFLRDCHVGLGGIALAVLSNRAGAPIRRPSDRRITR